MIAIFWQKLRSSSDPILFEIRALSNGFNGFGELYQLVFYVPKTSTITVSYLEHRKNFQGIATACIIYRFETRKRIGLEDRIGI